MKKFMLLFLVAMLSGCATENPHYSNAKKIGAFATGGIVVNAIARKTGSGRALAYGAGLLGGIIGVDLVKGAEWKPWDDEIVYIDQPAGYYPQSGYSSCGRASVYCNTTPKQGMYPPRPGMCNDPDSGGETTYEDLVRRAERRTGCYNNFSSGYVQQKVASYPQQQVVFPPNMWERHEKRQKVETKKSAGVVVGPTVSNYRDEPMIHTDCKTGNYGADGKCLKRLVDGLSLEQQACEGETKQAVCPKAYNPGKWAGIYTRLSNDLSIRQKEEQGGEFTPK